MEHKQYIHCKASAALKCTPSISQRTAEENMAKMALYSFIQFSRLNISKRGNLSTFRKSLVNAYSQSMVRPHIPVKVAVGKYTSHIH